MRVLIFLLFLVLTTVSNAQKSNYETGIQHFIDKDYTSAAVAFEKATIENPNFIDAYLWQAISVMATGESAGHILIRIPASLTPFHLTKYLNGLYWWTKSGAGNQSYARGYFKDALKEPAKSLGHQLAKAAIDKMDKNEAVPAVTEWPKLIRLKGADGKSVAAIHTLKAAMAQEKTATQKGLEKEGGPVVTGRYICRDFAGGGQMKHPSEYGTTSSSKWGNRFEISTNGTYNYLGAQKIPGTYTYNVATGKMAFKTGPFAPNKNGSSIRAENGIINGKPVILLYFNIPKYPETCEICFLQAN